MGAKRDYPDATRGRNRVDPREAGAAGQAPGPRRPASTTRGLTPLDAEPIVPYRPGRRRFEAHSLVGQVVLDEPALRGVVEVSSHEFSGHESRGRPPRQQRRTPTGGVDLRGLLGKLLAACGLLEISDLSRSASRRPAQRLAHLRAIQGPAVLFEEARWASSLLTRVVGVVLGPFSRAFIAGSTHANFGGAEEDQEGHKRPEHQPDLGRDEGARSPAPALGPLGRAQRSHPRKYEGRTGDEPSSHGASPYLADRRKQMTSAKSAAPSIRPAAISIAVWIVPADCG